jgi:hypothetical protein
MERVKPYGRIGAFKKRKWDFVPKFDLLDPVFQPKAPVASLDPMVVRRSLKNLMGVADLEAILRVEKRQCVHIGEMTFAP